MTAAAAIRPATASDVAALTALTRAAFQPMVAVIGREPLPMQTDYAKAILHDHIDLLDHNGPVALIHMVRHRDHLWVETIAVHPDQQGRGIGPRLMAHAEATAHSLNLPELRLLTNAALTANLRFYAKLGFTETSRPAFRGGFVVCYSKRLLSPEPRTPPNP